jgi:hypothetical protein
MWICQTRNQIPRSDYWAEQNMNGPRKTQGTSRLASATKPHGSMTISRIHRILPIFCTKLLKNSMTTTQPHKERSALALGTTPTWCLWRTKNENVLQSSVNPTRFRRKILSPNRRICLRRGRHTLATGKESTLSTQMLKTKNSPNCLLLGNIHSYRTKLRHLWTRIIGNNEVISALVTISGLDKRTVHHPYRSCQPSVLESPSKPQPKNGKVACGFTRIWLWNPTCP